tara:strand:- start:1031 stop:1786 length:756 start_codon:yes stop_codon:yes gene_type:complete
MAINEESVRWASVPSILPEDGLPNTSPRSTEFKNTGLQNNQPLPLQWLNGQFKDIYLALKEAQSQIDSIVGGSSQPTLESIYPVDALYMSFNSTTPDVALGFGTWVAIEGSFLVGVDSGDTDFDNPLETGGTKSHTHTNNLVLADAGGHTHTDTFDVDGHQLSVSQLPAHTHSIPSRGNSSGGNGYVEDADSTGTVRATNTGSVGSGEAHTHNLSGSISTVGNHNHTITGGIQSTSNLPPYTSIFMYRRTA